jgi:hypothetical protein
MTFRVGSATRKVISIQRLRELRAGRLGAGAVVAPDPPDWAPPEPDPPGQPIIPAGPYTETARGYLAPEDLPEPWRELYEERAAIREYDGGQAREHAEVEALREILAMMRDSAY